MPATMSLLGLYNWDASILDGLTVPTDVDKRTLINNLLRECAELEILYPQPTALKFFVGEWAKERLPVWERLAATLKFDYDPISNYDRREEWTDEDTEERDEQSSGRSSGSRNGSSSGRSSGSSSGSSSSSSSSSSSGESSTQTAGFNSAASNVPDKQQESSEESTTESSGESSTEGSEENSAESSEKNSAESSGETQSSVSRTAKRRGRAYGNIGVTTTQQMIEEERRISEFDIDHVIIQEFKKTFCLLIY